MCFFVCFVFDVWVFVIFLDSMRKKTADYADARVASPLVLLMLEHALAYRSRNASLSSLTLRPAVAAALALLFDVEEFLGSSKAAAKGEGALATKP